MTEEEAEAIAAYEQYCMTERGKCYSSAGANRRCLLGDSELMLQ